MTTLLCDHCGKALPNGASVLNVPDALMLLRIELAAVDKLGPDGSERKTVCTFRGRIYWEGERSYQDIHFCHSCCESAIRAALKSL